MNRRIRITTARRVLAAVMAPWLALLFAMPEAAHACAMHGGQGHAMVHEASASMAHDMAPGMSHDMSADLAAPTAPTAPTAPSSPTPAPSPNATYCTCPEGCCTVVVAFAAVPTSLSWVRELLAHRDPQYPRALPSVALSADVQLPFANGPPAQA